MQIIEVAKVMYVCMYVSVRVVSGSESVSDDGGVPGRRALHPTLDVRACANRYAYMLVTMYVWMHTTSVPP